MEIVHSKSRKPFECFLRMCFSNLRKVTSTWKLLERCLTSTQEKLSYLFKVAKDRSKVTLKRFSGSLSVDPLPVRSERTPSEQTGRLSRLIISIGTGMTEDLSFPGNLIKVTIARTQKTFTRFTVLLFFSFLPCLLFAQVPAAPSDLVATAQSPSEINLTWTNNSSNNDGLKIERKMRTNGTYSEIKTIQPYLTNFLDNGLDVGTQYYYRVRAYNTFGNSEYSNEASATTFAAPPTIVSFNPQNGFVGTSVIITGTNFNSVDTNNVVYFGAVKATISSATATSLSVIVPFGATYQPLSVTNLSTGLTAYSAKPFLVTFNGDSYISTSSFASRVDFTAGDRTQDIAISDFDGDGKPDIVTTNLHDSTISVFRNTSVSGDITSNSFASKKDFTIVGGYWYGVVADFDGDGKLDIIAGDIFRNESVVGNISFVTNNKDLVINNFGDLNADGKPDLVAQNWSSSTISIFRNTSTIGNISFDQNVDFLTGNQPNNIAIGDLDADGKPDLIVSNYNSNTLSILRNASTFDNISFANKVDFQTGDAPGQVLIGDLDGDNKPDIVCTNINSNTFSVYRNTCISGNITSSSFDIKKDFSTLNNPSDIALSDLDGDGKLDVALLNNGLISLYRNRSVIGDIRFDTNIDFWRGSAGIAIGDLDGDGKPDLATANFDWNTISILRNTIITYFPPAPLSISISPTGWSNNATSTISWTNPSDPSGISKVWYRIDTLPDISNPGSPVSISSPSFQLNWSTPGIHIIYFYLEDGLGNKDPANCVSVTTKFDNILPSVIDDSINVQTFDVDNPQAIAISASASDATAGMQLLQLQYKKGGTSWVTASNISFSSKTGGSASIPVNDLSDYAKYGVDYRVCAQDSAGNIAYTPVRSVTIRFNTEYTHTDASGAPLALMSTSDLPSGTPPEYAYRMFSVPLDLDNKSPKYIFETKTGIGDYNIKVWRFFQLKSDDSFEEYPDFSTLPVVEPGKSFLLILKDGIVIKTGPGAVLKTKDISDYGITLKAGYNFIGNPFNFDIPTDSLSLANGIPLAGRMWEFVGIGGTNGGWKLNPTILKAWEGIVINVGAYGPTTLLFHIADKPSSKVTKMHSSIAKEGKKEEGWRGIIRARRFDNGMYDEENIFGVSSTSIDSIDDKDAFEPPLVGDRNVSLSFNSPDGALTHDIRSIKNEGWVWDFKVFTPDEMAKVGLEFEGIQEKEGFLIDRDSRMVTRLRVLSHTAINVQKGGRHFRLIVGSNEFAAAHSDGIELIPTAYQLHQNYPNPFNPSTTIRFGLPVASNVNISIYDLLGRKVATVVDGLWNDGFHEIEWFAKVSSGVYFYRMEAIAVDNPNNRFANVKKMIVLK